MKADPEHAAIIAQRTWRGVIARRLFSDLLIASLEARLGPAPAVVPAFDLNEDEQKATANSRQSPSLEEAQLEASYNPSVTCFAHAATASVAAWQAKGGSSLPSTPNARVGSVSSFTPGDRAPAPSACHSRTPSAGAGMPAVVHVRTPSAGAPSASAPAAAGPGAGRQPVVPAQRSHHRRNVSEGANVRTAAALAAFNQNDGSDLEFTEETAERMSLDGLRELASVLTRVIVTRNKELMTLQLRRDELQRERDARQAIVSSLVAQVDRSQYVKEERKKSRRST